MVLGVPILKHFRVRFYLQTDIVMLLARRHFQVHQLVFILRNLVYILKVQ